MLNQNPLTFINIDLFGKKDLHILLIVQAVCISLLLKIMVAAYQRIAYSLSNKCYKQSDIVPYVAMIFCLFCIIGAELISGFIYGKIFFIEKKISK
jgi:hypothetical protein